MNPCLLEIIELELSDLIERDYRVMVDDPMLSENTGELLTYDQLTQGE